MALDDIHKSPLMTPENVAAQDDFLNACMREMHVLKTERPVPAGAVALTGFAMFCGGCLAAGIDPTQTFRELVDHGCQ